VNTPLFIAKRYLLAKKSHNLINIITMISVVGVGVGAFALIVVLSVFNGFEMVISKMVNQLAPDLVIEPVKGKTILLADFPEQQLRELPEVNQLIRVVQEDALFRFNDKQHVGVIKGVSEAYIEVSQIDSLISRGEALLKFESQQFAIVGAGVAWYLGLNPRNPAALMQVYLPSRGNPSSFQFEQSFNQATIQVSGVFTSQQELDASLVIVPYEWAAQLMEYEQEVTSVELFVLEEKQISALKKTLTVILGDSYTIKDKIEQQETIYRIMKSEKWAIFIILSFILVMATFNIIGSLSMLIVDKRKDIQVLKFLGADQRFLSRLFLTEGMLIAVSGGVIGLLAGVLLVFIQQEFGLLKLGGEAGAFVIDAYPVQLKIRDILLVFATVSVIGGSAAVFTVSKALKRIRKFRVSD
jgi:lipoprotein-releasing system permease protein